jgi:WD40 repeat protein
MDAKLNITLEDILKEEDDDVGVDPNVSVSVDAILNEPDDDITEKIFQTLKENLPLSQTLRSEEYRNAQDSNAHQNSTDALSKYSTSNSLSHATSPISSNSSKAFLNKSSSIETVSSAQHEQVAPSASTNVSGSFETTASEMKIDGEALQQILKETEDLNFKDLDEGTIDIDNLIHSMLLEEKMAAGSRGDDLLAQISAKEKQLINVEESKKLLEHLEQKRRKRKLQSNILDFMHLESISKKLSSPQMKNSAGIPCSIAISNKYIAVGTSHGFVIVFDHFHELQCVMIPQEDVEHGPVLSLDISSDSEWIVCGHQGGQLVVWDIAQRKPIKSLTDEHQNPIVLVRFLKTKDRFISVDTAGVVNYTTITRILLVYTASTQCILSGVQGQVFSVAVLLPGSIPHPIDSLELVALCTALKTIVVSFQSDKVKIVHQIPRPEGVREETLPHVAWRRVVIRETRGGQRKLMDPMLAIAWGNKIDLIQVLLTPKVETLPRYALEFASLQSYRTDAEICGLQWLGVNTIAFLTNSDELRVLDSSLLEEVEISNVKHMEIAYHTKFGMSRLCFANSMRSYKGHLYLLGLKGIWTGHLLTWSERLSALAKRSQWLDALSLAFDFYQGRSVGAEGLPRDPHIAKNLISKKIEELLEQFLSLGLSKNKTDSAPFILENEQPSHHHQYLATVSIDYCIALGRDDLLFNLVFPLFFKANEVGVFLERLEPFILGDKIQRLPPEIVKLLLHHYTTNKLFRRLEQLILHIPIPSLDFHQVVTLCRKHYLMSALFYVFIQALNDYITPLDDLIKILLKIETQKQSLSQEQQTLQKTIGYKVLIYLSYCFSGKSFPTEVPIAPDRWQTLCDEIFQYLLIESLDDIDFKYPRLHVLLQVDTKEFLRVMSICIDANFSTTSSNTTSIVLSKLVAVLLQLMVNTTEEAFSWSDQPKNASALYSPTQVGCFFRFLAQYFARKMIDLSAYLLNRVLSHLLLSTDKTTAKERETILLSLVKSYNDDRYNQDKILRLAEDANL